jgi:hypothetical protein
VLRPTGAFLLTALTVAGVSAGCTDSTPPTAPVPAAPAAPASVPPFSVPLGLPPASAFPPLAQPGEAYVADMSLYGGVLASRLVLYDGGDGRFALQFSHHVAGLSETRGRYTRAGSEIAFVFDAWGPATGTLRGDSLSIRYTPDMHLLDFMDGAYVRVPRIP